MKWLSFINGIAAILLILVAVSGLISNHLAGAGVAILGLIVLVLSALRWITGFARFSSGSHAPLHTA
jgi:hypothetical protein